MKVFIGICAYGEIHPDATMSMMRWAYSLGRRHTRGKDRLDLAIGIAKKKEQYRARNYLVRSAEKEGADRILMIDDDMLPHYTPDMLSRFLRMEEQYPNAGVLGGIYYQRGGLYHPVAMKAYEGFIPPFAAPGLDRHPDYKEGMPETYTRYRFYHPNEISDKPMRVDVVGGGCQWIKMELCDKMKEPHWWPFPYMGVFLPDNRYGLDVHFCVKAHELGYEMWIDPKIKLGHIATETAIITPDNRPSQEWIEQQQEYHDYWGAVYASAKFDPMEEGEIYDMKLVGPHEAAGG